MLKQVFLVRLAIAHGYEREVAEFVDRYMPDEEAEATSCFAMKMGSQTYGIFDIHDGSDEANPHIGNEIAKAIMEQAPYMLTKQPTVQSTEIDTIVPVAFSYVMA